MNYIPGVILEKESKEEIKEMLTAIIKPLVVEFEAAHNAHGKEIERLQKESLEHSQNFKIMDNSRQKQVNRCQLNINDKAEKSGIRIGELEQYVTRINEHIKGNTEDIKGLTEMFKTLQERKDFHLSQWLVGVGLILLIIFEIIPFIRGV